VTASEVRAALEAPLPTDPDVIRTCTHAEARDSLRSNELESARHLTGWPVMGGAIVTVDGPAHRSRRRLESVLFGHTHLRRYEFEMLQPAVDAALRRAAAGRDDDGIVRVDLVTLARRIMITISASIVGLDLADTDEVRHRRLDDCLAGLVRGVTVEWTHEDRGAVLEDAIGWKEVFDREFVAPALARRQAAPPGATGEAQHHPDLLAVLVADESHGLDRAGILTECVQYLTASSGTTATAVVHTVHHLLAWLKDHSEDAERLGDSEFLRAAAMESLRLHPGPHLLLRRATADVELRGRTIPTGRLVAVDVREANRDTEVYGERADEFDPRRSTGPGVPPEGFTFGGGRHVCIGRPLALGTYGRRGEAEVDGTIVRILRSVFAAGVRPSPTAEPTRVNGVEDRFGSYPVHLTAL
jgi:cytochrome P450